MAYTVFIDAGHGGADPGAVYQGRQEKDDNLDIALEVGRLLSEAGVDVVYSRTDDRYDSPFEKAMLGNNSNADLFVSIHRNAMPTPGTTSGVETLVYSDRGLAGEVARNINANLEQVGFVNRGVIERPNLVVLKRTRMPAVLVEVGFIDSETDNELLDSRFDEVAAAIANGILESIEQPRETMQENIETMESIEPPNMNTETMEEDEETIFAKILPPPPNPPKPNRPPRPTPTPLYRVQVGAFRNGRYANDLLQRLLAQGYPAFILQNNGVYRVQVGAFKNLENAIRMEARLRTDGYETFITT